MALCFRLASTNSRTSSLKSRLGTRNIHKRIPLPYSETAGLGRFLPPAALRTLVEYQDGLLSRLNEEVRADTKQENSISVAQTAVHYAKQRKRTLAFNYAVLALNNSFFLHQLSPPLRGEEVNHESKMSLKLAERIRAHYGDLPRLKSSFSANALGMFSNGWVWFVTDTGGELGILPTFGPSTLLIRSRENMNYNKGAILGEDDVEDQPPSLPRTPYSPFSKTPPPPTLTPGLGSGPSHPTTPPLHRSIHSAKDLTPSSLYEHPTPKDLTGSTAIDRYQKVGDVIYPLFCVPVYEHAWISAGFGIWGKEDWLKEFWTVLDWGKVSNAYESAQRNLV